MNKKQCEVLVRELTGVGVCHCEGPRCIHEVYLGNVLNQIHLRSTTKNGWNKTMEEVSKLWAKYGCAWSLNQIMEHKGFEEVKVEPEDDGSPYQGCSCHISPPCSHCEATVYEERLKDPDARALFEAINKHL